MAVEDRETRAALEVAAGVESVARDFLPGTPGFNRILSLIHELKSELGPADSSEPDVDGRPACFFLAELLSLIWFAAVLTYSESRSEQAGSLKARTASFCALTCAARKAGWDCWSLFTDRAEQNLERYLNAFKKSGGRDLSSACIAAADSCLAALMQADGVPLEKLEKRLGTGLPSFFINALAETVRRVRSVADRDGSSPGGRA